MGEFALCGFDEHVASAGALLEVLLVQVEVEVAVDGQSGEAGVGGLVGQG